MCPQANNDVLALLEMMLTFGQMMLCLAAQMKKSKSFDLDKKGTWARRGTTLLGHRGNDLQSAMMGDALDRYLLSGKTILINRAM